VQLRIRNATNDDLDSFVQIYKEAYRGLEEYAYTKTKDIRWYFRWLMNRDRDGFFVAEVDGKPVGFVGCDANWVSLFENDTVGEIHEIFVHPSWQRMGIGKILLLKALDYAKSKGRKLAGLWVGMTNERAKRFYKKMGFVETGSWGKWLRMIKTL